MDKEKKKYTNTKGPGSSIETPFTHNDTRRIARDLANLELALLSDEEALLKKKND